MSASLAADVARDWMLELGAAYPPGAAGYVVRAELAGRDAGRPEAVAGPSRGRAGGGRARALGRRRRGAAASSRRRALRAPARALRARDVPLERRRRPARGPDRIAAAALEGRDRLPHARGGGGVVARGRRSRTDVPGRRCVTPRFTTSASLRPRRESRSSSTRTCTATTCSRRSAKPWLVIDPKPLAGEREFCGRADRPQLRARPLEARRALPARPALRRARPRPRARPRLDGRADGRMARAGENIARRRAGEVIEWLS